MKTRHLQNGYRHSKWLSFMNERLQIARDLLSDNGVMFISIDENEFSQLKLLCDSIFNEENIETIIWNKVPEYGTAGSGKMKITYRFIVASICGGFTLIKNMCGHAPHTSTKVKKCVEVSEYQSVLRMNGRLTNLL